MFNSTANTNLETGIPYGVVSMNSLKGWVWDEVQNHCESLTYHYWSDEVRTELQQAIDELLENEQIPKDDVKEALDLINDKEADIDTLKWFLEDIDEEGIYKDIIRQEYEPDEEEYEGEIHDEKGSVHVFLSYIGGAPTLWVAESPYTTETRECSLCVPNGGDLDSKEYSFINRATGDWDFSRYLPQGNNWEPVTEPGTWFPDLKVWIPEAQIETPALSGVLESHRLRPEAPGMECYDVPPDWYRTEEDPY